MPANRLTIIFIHEAAGWRTGFSAAGGAQRGALASARDPCGIMANAGYGSLLPNRGPHVACFERAGGLLELGLDPRCITRTMMLLPQHSTTAGHSQGHILQSHDLAGIL
jgi:hypothetical protein